MTDSSSKTNTSAHTKKFENIIKQSDVLNQTVFDSVTMDELGRIEVLWMYPQINRVLGFVCKSGFLGSKKAAFKLPQLESIGTNGILVRGHGEPTVAAKVKQLESLIHSEVWSESGDRVGYIIDCLFNYRSGVIVRYLMVPSRLGGITEGVYFLSPKAIKSFGRQRVLIYADAADTLKPYRKGWKYKLAEVRDTVRDDYVSGVQEELRSFTQQVQGFSKTAMHRVEGWGDRLRTETQTFLEQAKEQSQAFYEKARTSGQAIFDQIRSEGLSFNDHMQDTAARSEADVNQNITFPEEEDDAAAAVTQGYDHESWDDEWNDWEDQQHWEGSDAWDADHAVRVTSTKCPPLDDDVWGDAAPQGAEEQDVRLDDDWVDGNPENSSDTHQKDEHRQASTSQASASSTPHNPAIAMNDADDDPWI